MHKLALNPYRLVLALIDAGIIGCSTYLAFLVRFDGAVPVGYLSRYWVTIVPIIAIGLACFLAFGLYRQIWAYASVDALLSIIYAVSLASVFGFIYTFSGVGMAYPYSVVIISWLLNLLLVGGSRFLWRITREKLYVGGNADPRDDLRKRVLIVGAGDAGESILREMLRVKNGYCPVGLVDDNCRKTGMSIHGIKILGTRRQIPEIVKAKDVNEVIIAIPTASGATIRDIVACCENAGVKYKTLPPIYELIDGKVSVNHIREVNEEDLLNREPIRFDFDEIRPGLQGKTVLVTGAGGSIGSELCRQIARCLPDQLVILGQGENSIYQIDLKLRETNPACKIVPVIANVRDRQRMETVLGRFKPQVVFHAAAYKHVWLMEQNPEEAYGNNVVGTSVLAEACLRFGVERFVMISTDKAVKPTSVMGSSKREAELVVLGLHGKGKTKFMVTRFGNVMNSRGSVIPLFRRQISQRRALTVTHPQVVRFFMTIPEAVQLVIRAALMGDGGEIFVLDMGKPLKIVDLAKEMVSLSGLELGKDINIEFTGLKPGEKISEELSFPEERLEPTCHKNILATRTKILV